MELRNCNVQVVRQRSTSAVKVAGSRVTCKARYYETWTPSQRGPGTLTTDSGCELRQLRSEETTEMTNEKRDRFEKFVVHTSQIPKYLLMAACPHPFIL
jgi:hypothetical protein